MNVVFVINTSFRETSALFRSCNIFYFLMRLFSSQREKIIVPYSKSVQNKIVLVFLQL